MLLGVLLRLLFSVSKKVCPSSSSEHIMSSKTSRTEGRLVKHYTSCSRLPFHFTILQTVSQFSYNLFTLGIKILMSVLPCTESEVLSCEMYVLIRLTNVS